MSHSFKRKIVFLVNLSFFLKNNQRDLSAIRKLEHGVDYSTNKMHANGHPCGGVICIDERLWHCALHTAGKDLIWNKAIMAVDCRNVLKPQIPSLRVNPVDLIPFIHLLSLQQLVKSKPSSFSKFLNALKLRQAERQKVTWSLKKYIYLSDVGRLKNYWSLNIYHILSHSIIIKLCNIYEV